MMTVKINSFPLCHFHYPCILKFTTVFGSKLCNIFVHTLIQGGELFEKTHLLTHTHTHTHTKKKKKILCFRESCSFENSLLSAKLLIHICKKIKASLWGWP